MRKGLDLWIHLGHVALLVTAATLDDWRERRPMRTALDPVAGDIVPDVHRPLPGGAHNPELTCAMPVWRPDPNMRYAMLVIGSDHIDGGASSAPGSAACVNPYVRFAASPPRLIPAREGR